MAELKTAFVGKSPRIAIEYMGAGPLLVFLHGVGGNRTNWREQLPVFADHFTTVAWDARGWGDSEDYDGPYQFSDVVEDLMGVYEFFGVEKAVLVGLSMGGRICLETWKRRPEKIRALVLADTSAGMHDKISPEKMAEQMRMRREPLMKENGARLMAEIVAPKLVSPHATPEVVERLKDSLAAVHVPSYIKALETVAGYNDFPPYGSITVPVLIVNGMDDPLAPPHIAEHMEREIPDSRRVMIPDCGHLSNMEKPEEFNQALLAFLLPGKEKS
jgi:3-oxoadipate enol-lactonase